MPLSSTQMVAEPAAFYGSLREHGPLVPVHLDGDVPAWLVIGHDACAQVLKGSRNGRILFTRDLGQWGVAARGHLPTDWPLAPHVWPMENMLFASGGEHRRLRSAFRTSLRMVSSARRKAIIRRVADQLIDSFVDQGTTDLVSRYAVPLPVAVLAQLFGFPPEAAVGLRRAIPTLLAGGSEALAANAELDDAIAAHVQRRQQVPRMDITSGLLENLEAEETRRTIWLAINASVSATSAWIANTCVLLARAENARIDVRSGTRPIPAVMNEVLWEHTPVQQVIGRVATADVNLFNTVVRRGDLLILSLAAAGLDEKFGDARRRPENVANNESHLSWGLGDHECPAQPEATDIVDGGIRRLWERLDDLHVSDPEQPTAWSPSIIVRIPSRFDVAWDPARARARAHTLAPSGDHS
ncbi:hypothetical protein ACTMUQ_30890 [Streptomyces sp. SD11]|uniref:hypothetical protein n=1 Tax=Streptomyces sp. SD11 TaxID=3452209 RepID=UPI003F8B6E0F